MEHRHQGMKLPVSQNEIVNPLCIILVKNGSKGDRLLFRYPWKALTLKDQTSGEEAGPPISQKTNGVTTNATQNQSYPTRHSTLTEERVSRPNFHFRRDMTKSKSPEKPQRPRNPYAIRNDGEDEMGEFSGESNSSTSTRKFNISMDLSDKDLSNLLAVNTELSERKFELKVNDVRFVGHPTLMQHPSIVRPINTAVSQTSTKIFHVVFCLHAMASHSIVKCFYDLSKRLGIGLRHEEYRCGYMSQELKTIIGHLDEGCQQHEEEDQVEQNYFQHASQHILQTSSLAQLLKSVYDDICATGFVKLRVNNWIQLSFCLPQKIHVIPFRDPSFLVEPEEIHRCLESIRPYHALLLLVDREELAASFSVDSSPSIPRLLQVYSPLKSLQVIAADADLTLSHVVEIASHLVYWAVATLIYPMCETNVYVIAPDAPMVSSEMEETFLNSFPGLSLTQTLADFSLPMPLGERANPVLGGSYLQTQLVQLVCWLLQYRLLIQLHTYLYLLPYLDENGIHNSLSNGQDCFNMEVRPYEPDGDDVTVSDSYSETAVEDISGIGIPIPSEAALGIIERESTSAAAAAIILEPTSPEESVDGIIRKDKVNGEVPLEGTEDEPSPATLKATLSQLSETARRAIEMVKPELGLADIKLFGRLSKYFNGEFHFEEIMYRENVRRSQLLLLVDKFREVLITSEREDSSINFFKVEHW